MKLTRDSAALGFLMMLISFVDVSAWVTAAPSNMRTTTTALDAVQRRNFLFQSAMILPFLVPAGAIADGDNKNHPMADLDAFGKELSEKKKTSGYPLTPSPLPTSVKSAAELTKPNSDEAPLVPTLQDAIEKSSKKKRIDPRTHG